MTASFCAECGVYVMVTKNDLSTDPQIMPDSDLIGAI